MYLTFVLDECCLVPHDDGARDKNHSMFIRVISASTYSSVCIHIVCYTYISNYWVHIAQSHVVWAPGCSVGSL